MSPEEWLKKFQDMVVEAKKDGVTIIGSDYGSIDLYHDLDRWIGYFGHEYAIKSSRWYHHES